MKDSSKQEVTELMHSLSDKGVDTQVNEVKVKEALDELRYDIFDFFKKRLNHIEEQERFKMKVQTALEGKISEDSLEFSELLSLYRLIFTESSTSSEQIINLFKPVPGANSPLQAVVQPEEKVDKFDEIFNSMSKEELERLNAVYRHLSKNEEKKD